jgi:hypothetical protein
MLNFDTIAMVSYPGGELLATYGGPQSDYADMSWNRQHGHHVLEGGLLVFNNQGSGGGSSVLEYETNGSSADLVMDYSSGVSTQTFGGVERLPNGNTLAAFSNAGTIHELNPSGDPVRIISGSGVGYVVRRTKLYGPPPPYAD